MHAEIVHTMKSVQRRVTSEAEAESEARVYIYYISMNNGADQKP